MTAEFRLTKGILATTSTFTADERESARNRGSQIEIRPIKKYLGVADAVEAERGMCQFPMADLRLQQAINVVIVTRDALTLVLEFAAPLKPSPLSVDDDDLIPACPLGDDGRDTRDVEIQ
jgi:hypothetical protein